MKKLAIAKQICTLSIVGLMLFSCSKNDSDNPLEPIKDGKRLSKIETDVDNYMEFKYTNGALTELVDVSGGELSRSTITYHNNRPVEVHHSDGKIKFVYEDDRLVKEELYATDAQTANAYNQYVYQGKQVKEVTGYGLLESEVPYFKRKMFYNPNGEVERVEIYTVNDEDELELSIKTSYEYDNKTNPYATSAGNYLALFTQTYSRHNVVKETTVDETGELHQVITTSYTYDKDGYPLTAIEKTVNNGGDPVTVNKKFIYVP